MNSQAEEFNFAKPRIAARVPYISVKGMKMKISIFAIALSLIGASVAVLAQEFPAIDIDAACRNSYSMFTGNTFTTITKTCMESARTSLVLAKSDWERSSPQAKEKCLSATKLTLGQEDFYDLLFSCLSDEIITSNLASHEWTVLNNKCRSGSNQTDTDRICAKREKAGVLLEQRGCTYIGYRDRYRCSE